MPASDFAAAFFAASTAELITLPVDTCKVKLQLDPLRKTYHNSFHTFQMVRAVGWNKFWPGVSAAMLRSGVFNCCRLGIYETTLHKIANLMGSSTDSITVKAIAALPVSAVSIACANPWDVVKVRCQKQPDYVRRIGLDHCVAADPRVLAKIARSEGVLRGLYSGFGPNLARNCIIGTTELTTYFQAKQTFMALGFADNTATHALSSAVAGLMATILGSPMDVLGTRMMQKAAVEEGLNPVQYGLKMMRDEGPQAFYKGFWLNWMRIGGFNMVMFVGFERLRQIFPPKPGDYGPAAEQAATSM